MERIPMRKVGRAKRVVRRRRERRCWLSRDWEDEERTERTEEVCRGVRVKGPREVMRWRRVRRVKVGEGV